MALADAGTLLVIAPQGLPPYAARGIVETLEPVALATDLHRTVNGVLVSVAPAKLRKYKIKLTGKDQQPPPVDSIYPDLQITIDCITELAFLTLGNSPQRPVVTGSLRIEGDFTFYRPQLTAIVTGFSVSTGEWTGDVGWTLDAEEV
jgi:hypothetical protein